MQSPGRVELGMPFGVGAIQWRLATTLLNHIRPSWLFFSVLVSVYTRCRNSSRWDARIPAVPSPRNRMCSKGE